MEIEKIFSASVLLENMMMVFQYSAYNVISYVRHAIILGLIALYVKGIAKCWYKINVNVHQTLMKIMFLQYALHVLINVKNVLMMGIIVWFVKVIELMNLIASVQKGNMKIMLVKTAKLVMKDAQPVTQ